MKIYLAGPDVFRPDALTWAEEARALLARHGHYALIPSDNNETSAEGIFRANIEMISEADAVIANLNPFRGCEPDSGTCFEIGCAIALGKQVIAYLADTRPQLDKLAEFYGGTLARREGRAVRPRRSDDRELRTSRQSDAGNFLPDCSGRSGRRGSCARCRMTWWH